MTIEQPSTTPNESRPVRRRRSGAFWGAVLIVVGVIIFAQQTGLLSEQFNWWALFILIPAFGSLGAAFTSFQSSGKFNAAVRSSLGGAIVLLTLTFILLFGLNWAVYWPLMVVAAGFSFFINGLETDGSKAGIISMQLWIGLGAIYLGLGFLADKLGWLDPQAYFGPYRWWAVAILIPGAGALINALIAAARGGKFFGAAFGLVVFGLMVIATGVVALLGFSWNLLGPILLIVVGLGVMLGIFFRKM